MTDSATTAAAAPEGRSGKRPLLVDAARQLVYQQGVENTTLADIAGLAGMAVGNVYYYFKTKDEILAAVIDSRAEDLRRMISELERSHRSPRARLKALIAGLAAHNESVARYGCAMGTLCSELDKRDPGAGPHAAQLLQIPVDWAEQQFRSMGRPDARDLATDLLASYEGYALLTNTFRDPKLWTTAARRLQHWIDTVESPGAGSPCSPPSAVG